jgi:flagellin
LTNAISASISSVTGAISALTRIDAALTAVNETRATWGSVISRFESVIANTQSVLESTEASRSRIRDADFAKEAAALAKEQIMQQAGTTMLAQANAQAQSVLQLLNR